MPNLVTMNEASPHTALIRINIEVHEKMPSGEYKGSPQNKQSRLYKIDGFDKSICLRKIHEFLERVKELCN